ncbi:hypothetical protein F5146DRAFT_1201781 [Armillaria mellea]|nr:hypothetical protein F5146DRAFT_1201781 [Armillaria mellea]
MYLGTMVAAILFGITNLQTVIYFKNYPGDWWVYRYSVASLWILDALHVALSTHALYHYLITLYGNILASYDISMELQGTSIYLTFLSMNLEYHQLQNLFCVVLWFAILSVVAAFSTGICKSYLSSLWIRLSKSILYQVSYPFPKVKFLMWPNSFIFIGILFILPKLYINSLLAMLNSRKKHRSKSEEYHVPSVMRFPPQNHSGNSGELGINTALTETQTLDHPKDGHTGEA